MKITTNSPISKAQIDVLRQSLVPDAQSSYTTRDGQAISIPATGKFNLATNKAGAIIPLLWDAAKGRHTAVFKAGEDLSLISDSDIQQASSMLADAVEGNILINSDGTRVQSNNTIVINSPNTILGEVCNNTSVINSPATELHECEFGVIKNSPEFFGWFSHWLHVENSDGGQVLDSDKVEMLNSRNGRVYACEYLKMNDSENAHYSQSSNTSVHYSPNSVGYEINNGNILTSPGLAAAYSYKILTDNSGGNGILHSPLSTIRNSPQDNNTLGAEINNQYKQESVKIVAEDGNFEAMSEAQNEVFARTILETLEQQANISGAPEATIQESPNVNIQISVKPTIQRSSNVTVDQCDDVLIKDSNKAQTQYCSRFEIHNSPETNLRDSTTAKVINSPRAVLDNSMGRTVIDEADAKYINQPVDSKAEQAIHQELLTKALS